MLPPVITACAGGKNSSQRPVWEIVAGESAFTVAFRFATLPVAGYPPRKGSLHASGPLPCFLHGDNLHGNGAHLGEKAVDHRAAQKYPPARMHRLAEDHV